MKAIVKKDSPHSVITSCGGAEFRKDQYLPVPAGLEDEARSDVFLITDEDENAPVLSPLPEAESVSVSAPSTADGEVDATDGAVTLADDLGIDLSEVEGSGADGRILKPDVVVFAEAMSKSEQEPEPESEDKEE